MARKKRKIKRIKPKPYTGLTPVQPAASPQSAGPVPTGSTSIAQSDGMQDQGNGEVLTGLLAGKEAYDQMGSRYQSGKDLRKGVTGLPEKFDRGVDYMSDKFVTPVTDWYNDKTTLTDMSQLPQSGISYPSGKSGVPYPSGGGTIGLGSSPAQNVANRWGLTGSSSQLGSQPASTYLAESMAPHWGTELSPALKDAVLGDPVALGPTTQTLDGARITGTGLQTEPAIDATAGEAGLLSKAGALAGLGLNAYDIAENGLTPTNAMGLAGSGVLAGTTMLGLSQAWNPVGWALLGGSAVGSLTDWW